MDLKLDDNNDLVIEDNELVLLDGGDLVAQLLKEKLQTFQGEWFLDTSLGVPYFQDILKKQVDLSGIGNIFKDQILNTPGILGLTNFNLDYTENNRNLSLNFSVRSEDGEITINIEELGT